jgi:2,3-bisphosphoglycerate-dependent phosphoglycerate mutase
MELYLIRHGQSANNEGILPRVPDPPLTDLGVEQARWAGESLKDEGITRLYCSPMLRTLQTAQIISEILDLPPHVFVGLHEWGGIWEARGDGTVQLPGLTSAEMREICPDVVLPDNVTDQGWWFNEGFAGDIEGMLQLAHENALAFIAHLTEHHVDTGQRIAAVAHGGLGASLISAFFSLPPNVNYDRFTQSNTGVSKMLFTSERRQLLYLNRISHLPPEAVTS